MKEYHDVTGPGSYQWKCSDIDSQNHLCRRCESSYVLGLGRCYTPIKGCTLQYSSSCFICQDGWFRHHEKCYREINTQNSIIHENSSSTSVKIVTTTSQTYYSSKSISGECLQY